MVQLTSKDFSLPKEYWKLVRANTPTGKDHRQRLQKQQFAITTSSYTAARMTYLISRCDRGMMSYEKRDKAELKLFCLARRIKLPSNHGRKKAGWIKLLENEDEHGTTFRYFLDLPPELRLRVYEYYFSACEDSQVDLQRTRTILQPPPVSQACRLLRQETLPLFTRLYRFNILHERYMRFGEGSLHAHAFRKAPHHLIQMLRQIRISGAIITRGFTFKVSWDIELPMGERSLKVTRKNLAGRHRGVDAPSQLSQEVGNILDHQMDVFLKQVKDRAPAGEMELNRHDYTNIRSIFISAEISLNISFVPIVDA